ncbi:MAG: 2TM domain-containing protein [Holosporales bacterium]|jgi:hypothetical protein|nr:2TM domain-containing protein [Holosporales bacterium]
MLLGSSKEEIRRYVRELKLLYKEIFISVGIFLMCLVAWITTGGGFWPLWVFLAFAIKIFIRVISVGIINEKACFGRFTSFLSPEWEEKQIEKYSKIFDEDQRWENEEEEEENEDNKAKSDAKIKKNKAKKNDV